MPERQKAIDELTLVEVGPRMCLTPIKVFGGRCVRGGERLFSSGPSLFAPHLLPSRPSKSSADGARVMFVGAISGLQRGPQEGGLLLSRGSFSPRSCRLLPLTPSLHLFFFHAPPPFPFPPVTQLWRRDAVRQPLVRDAQRDAVGRAPQQGRQVQEQGACCGRGARDYEGLF